MISRPVPPASVSYLKLYVSGALGILVVLGFTLGRVLSDPQSFALRFNGFAVASAMAIITNLAILLLVIRKGTRSETTGWFVLYTLAALSASISEFFMRSSAHPVGALFWEQTLGLGLGIVPVALYLFVLAYTRGTALRHIFIAPLLLMGGALVAFVYGNSNLIIGNRLEQIKSYSSGWASIPGPLFSLDLVWIFTLFIISIMLLLTFHRATHNPILKRQSWYYFWVFLVPFAFGAVVDGILPLAGMSDLPNVAVFINAIMAALIYRGVRMYRLLELNPAILAQNILGTMREAVVVAGKDLRLEFVNEEAERLLGITNKKDVYPTLDQLFPKSSWKHIERHLIHGTPLNTEVGALTAYNQEGETIPIQLATSTLMEGRTYQAYILVLSDIRHITASYKIVERMVEERTHELREAQDRLQAEDRLKREFIAVSSHNLGTPLSVMQGSLQLIKTTEDTQQREELFNMLENGMKRLTEFVEDMSAISTLEAGGRLDTQPLTVQRIIEPLVEETTAFCTAKHLSFKTDLHKADATVNGNLIWLRSCIRNLLDNALKFTHTGSITLRTTVRDKYAELTIADTGIGIHAKEMPLLFIKFHRGTDFEQYDYEGEGLGLYLTKLIVEQHGGTITVESKFGKGSVFTIRLPLYDQAEEQQQ